MIDRPAPRFTVGDEVVWTSVNHEGEKRHRVEKVGRSLVYISGDPKPYRIATGARADGYGHSRIRSLATYEWDERVSAAYRYFHDHGLTSNYRTPVSDSWIVAAVKVLREELS